jgi:hypothetical protein
VETVDGYARSDAQCATEDDKVDSDVTENEIEGEDEPLDLFD